MGKCNISDLIPNSYNLITKTVLDIKFLKNSLTKCMTYAEKNKTNDLEIRKLFCISAMKYMKNELIRFKVVGI